MGIGYNGTSDMGHYTRMCVYWQALQSLFYFVVLSS